MHSYRYHRFLSYTRGRSQNIFAYFTPAYWLSIFILPTQKWNSPVKLKGDHTYQMLYIKILESPRTDLCRLNWPSGRNFVFLIPAFQVHSTAFFPNPLQAWSDVLRDRTTIILSVIGLTCFRNVDEVILLIFLYFDGVVYFNIFWDELTLVRLTLVLTHWTRVWKNTFEYLP